MPAPKSKDEIESAIPSRSLVGHPDQLLEAANDLAAVACRAWLLATGLAAEIDDLRLQEEGRLVPAPGLEQLKEEAEAEARRATEGADLVSRLVQGLDLTTEPGELEATTCRAAAALDLVCVAAARTEEICRAVAQLGFGVSAHTLGGDRIERLDRACVAVLRPPYGGTASLADEHTGLRGRTIDELRIEVAGLLCRLLVERGEWLTFAVPGGHIRVTVDKTDMLAAEARITDVAPKAAAEAALSRYGWNRFPGGSFDCSWESPVMVSEPAGQVVELLRALGLETPAGLRIDCGREGGGR